MKVTWAWGIGVLVAAGLQPGVLAAPDADAVKPKEPAPATTASVTAKPAATPASAAAASSAEPSASQMAQAIKDYIAQIKEEEGDFTIEDEVTGGLRTLTLEQVHDQPNKIEDGYSICTDMKDTNSGDALDVDFDLDTVEGKLEVLDVRIHKVNGQARPADGAAAQKDKDTAEAY